MKPHFRLAYLAALAISASGCKPSVDIPTDQQAADALYSEGPINECMSLVDPTKQQQSPECLAAKKRKRAAFIIKIEKCNEGAQVPMIQGATIPTGVTCTLSITFDEMQREPSGRVAIFFKAANKWNGSLL
ncbi:hypothetical protein [Methylocystis iwaonis]|uniref:Lipoprotein n=1 Tax=Methylocystis iwaonis TaxID=2885079 RepID=A0ABM8EE62_9HYPH|nr:hypothetical protein [Methylocystis iwaonis]BDV36318.1 hypothetical protein SS37A_38480 [Methylocystis iwaonis]